MFKSLFVLLAAAGFACAQGKLNGYPTELNSTDKFGFDGSFFLYATTTDPALWGKNYQVKKGPTGWNAGLSNSSDPVATFRLSQGQLYLTKRNSDGKFVDVGQIATLIDSKAAKGNQFKEVVFIEEKGAKSEYDFYLTGGKGGYDLSVRAPVPSTYAFYLCSDLQKPSTANFWKLVWAVSKENVPTELDYCEHVTPSTVLPLIDISNK